MGTQAIVGANRRPFRCRIGWHKWKQVGSTLMLNPVYKCLLCSTVKVDMWSGTVIYNALEQRNEKEKS
jgi:hypothetical protein